MPQAPTTLNAPAALLDALRDRLHWPALEFDGQPAPLSGGFWAEMWAFALTPKPGGWPANLVARFAPDPELGAWETAAQSTIAEADFPTPRIRAHGTPEPVLPFAWSVMDHASGRPLLAGLDGVSALLRLPRLAGQLPGKLATVAALLHQIDPTALRMIAEPHAVGVSALLDNYAATAAATGDRTLQRLVDRLVAQRPPDDDQVICHGDIHPFNVLDDDGHLTLLDWTASRIADRCYDIAFTSLMIAVPPLAAPRAIQPVIATAGRALARRFVRVYERSAGTSLDRTRLAWYRNLQIARILTDLANWRAADQLEAHRSHPWVSMQPTLLAELREPLRRGPRLPVLERARVSQNAG